MEVVTLNEQLREEFAGVTKHFLTIRREEIVLTAAALAEAAERAKQEREKAQANESNQTEEPPTPGVKPSETDASADSENQEERDTQKAEEPSERDANGTSDEAAQKPAPSGSSKATDIKMWEPGAVLPERTRKFAMRAKAILRQINMYQYSSREQFGRDIAELLTLADSSDQKLLLRQLVDQQRALTDGADNRQSNRPKRQKGNGIRLDSASIPGIQCRTPATWAYNLDLEGNLATVGVYTSREKALEKYGKLWRDSRHSISFTELQDMASDLKAARSKFDEQVLLDAMNQVKQRLPVSRHNDASSLSTVSTPQTPSQPQQQPHQQLPIQNGHVSVAEKREEIKASRKRELVVDTSVPPTVATNSNGKPITPASATPELVALRTPTDANSRIKFLPLRRLIQMRLCRHLEGREICPRLNDSTQEETWEATGKLERGKVFVYKTKRFMGFAEYVQDTLKRSVAACEHLYVVETRENIDAHLLVCDQFNDEFRERMHKNFKEASDFYLKHKHGKMK